MTDRQNRVGSKFGGGGVASAQNMERDRKERLRELALESVDLSKDPYLMRNHLGTYECKLCLTLHPNEGNYLAHTQGKKHQAGLAKRALLEQQSKEAQPAAAMVASSTRARQMPTRVKIGRPGYEIQKSRDPQTNQRCLSFSLSYPKVGGVIDDDVVQPRHRFMSAYEQRQEPPDKRYQYLLIACEPYETVAFKIPNDPIDRREGRFVTNWDLDRKTFTLTLYFRDSEPSRD
jgi:splicing factor 3A subunit 2